MKVFEKKKFNIFVFQKNYSAVLKLLYCQAPDKEIFMPPPQSGGGRIVLHSIIYPSVCPSMTLYSTVCVSKTPPTVFKVAS